MATCGSVFRCILYVLMAASMAMLLYGLLRMKAEVDTDSLHGLNGYCLLAGDWRTVQLQNAIGTTRMPESGSKSLCEFAIFSAVAQLVAAILLAVFTLIRCVTHRDRGNSRFSMLEAILVLPVFLVSLATALEITIGLYVFCSNLLGGDDWSKNSLMYNGYAKPSSCKDSYILQKSFASPSRYDFFKDLNIGQIGAWAGVGLWLAHSILTIISFRGYRRENRLGTAHAVLASAEGTSVGKYAKMKNPGAL